jgi:hypothetical protein
MGFLERFTKNVTKIKHHKLITESKWYIKNICFHEAVGARRRRGKRESG